MVKSSLSFLVALAFGMVACASSFDETPIELFDIQRPVPDKQRCVPEVFIKEYRPFVLVSYKLDSSVSRELDENLLVGGVDGDKSFQRLEFCFASTEYGCSSSVQSSCIYPHVEYRMRVHSPIEGYLRIKDGMFLEIVEDFEKGSVLGLYKELGWGLRIAHRGEDGVRTVLAVDKPGKPAVMEPIESNAPRQWFELQEVHRN
ncbi:hypothetical protein BGZ93_009885 [Podila epicladia]|nr:hypothetical protein BGZ92_007658 [Podila epicladia]KAG0098912.1 hypothetical protein BGZ93_009885 [Podila epicladia]